VKKSQLDHVLRAAGRITGDRQFIIIGSQSLHGKRPDLADTILKSIEADLIAKNERDRTEWLNAIGVDSPFHQSFGYYADPVDERSAVLPKGWKGQLVQLAAGDTEGAVGLCLDPHDLAISKYVARREKDIVFNRELARRGIVNRKKMLELLAATPIPEVRKAAIRGYIDADFPAPPDDAPQTRKDLFGRQGSGDGRLSVRRRKQYAAIVDAKQRRRR
jgi:hypothetical protein